MNTKEILKTHNAWRGGDDTRTQCELGFSVTELGIAIDDAVRIIDERDQLRAELEECTRAWAIATSELATASKIIRNKRWAIEQLEAENQQLAAQVERLREALSQAVQHWEYDGVSPEHGSAFTECNARIDETPAQSLAEIRAEAIERAADRIDEWLQESDDLPEVLLRRIAIQMRTTNKSGGGDD